mmetsp:Transcript_41131/g.118861  ORF Transcript_41131/g.118861 Transcript_41131/m.118861 type:complete len:208 (+) Transcript_41131:71-694(+)
MAPSGQRRHELCGGDEEANRREAEVVHNGSPLSRSFQASQIEGAVLGPACPTKPCFEKPSRRGKDVVVPQRGLRRLGPARPPRAGDAGRGRSWLHVFGSKGLGKGALARCLALQAHRLQELSREPQSPCHALIAAPPKHDAVREAQLVHARQGLQLAGASASACTSAIHQLCAAGAVKGKRLLVAAGVPELPRASQGRVGAAGLVQH